MKKYKNISTTLLAFTLIVDGKNLDCIIPPSETKELPSDNAYIKRLVKQKFLEELAEVKVSSNGVSNKPQNEVTNPQKDNK